MNSYEFREKLKKVYSKAFIDYDQKIIVNGKTFFVYINKVFLSFSYVGSMFSQASCKYLSNDTFTKSVLRNPNYEYDKLIGYHKVTDIEKLFIIKNIDIIKTNINTISIMTSKSTHASTEVINLYINFDDFFLLKL